MGGAAPNSTGFGAVPLRRQRQCAGTVNARRGFVSYPGVSTQGLSPACLPPGLRPPSQPLLPSPTSISNSPWLFIATSTNCVRLRPASAGLMPAVPTLLSWVDLLWGIWAVSRCPCAGSPRSVCAARRRGAPLNSRGRWGKRRLSLFPNCPWLPWSPKWCLLRDGENQVCPGLRPLVELCVEPAGLCGRCTGVAVPLRVVPIPFVRSPGWETLFTGSKASEPPEGK